VTQGPNVKRLIVAKMSRDAIPAGGGVADGIKFLSDPTAVLAGARVATQWVEEAIRLVREAADPNPWRQADDEAIAAEVLRRLGERGRTVEIDSPG
jgi:hypothetical protein